MSSTSLLISSPIMKKSKTFYNSQFIVNQDLGVILFLLREPLDLEDVQPQTVVSPPPVLIHHQGLLKAGYPFITFLGRLTGKVSVTCKIKGSEGCYSLSLKSCDLLDKRSSH